MGKAAGPAKAGADGGGMDKAELKRVLRLAQPDDPVHVAFALGADGKAVVVADKRKQPRALEKELKEAAPDSRNHRFGTASPDPADPKLVRFTVNKAAGGMGRKLAVALKGTGFSKVEVGSEDGTPPERHEEADEAEGAPAAAQGAAGAAGAGAAGAAATAGAAEMPPAQARGDHDAQAEGGSQPHAPSPVLDRARAAWEATLKKVEHDFQTLRGAVVEAYKEDAAGPELVEFLEGKAAETLSAVNRGLGDQLSALAQNKDPAAHAKLVQDARRTITQLTDHVAKDPTIAAIDGNPFVPTTVGKSVSDALSALSKAVA